MDIDGNSGSWFNFDWDVLAVNISSSFVANVAAKVLCLAISALACLLAGAAISAVAAAGAANYEADQMGLTGRERANFIAQSALIGAVSFGVFRGTVAVGQKALRASMTVRNAVKKSKFVKKFLIKQVLATPSRLTKFGLNTYKRKHFGG